MPYWNTISRAILISACISSPAFADGRDQPRPEGPSPLQPHAELPCGELMGCEHPTPHRIIRHVSAPPVIHHRNDFRHDFSGFNGGVGANIGGGYAGGGGGVIVINGARSFSGVQARANAMASASAQATATVNIAVMGGGMCCK